MVTRKRGFKPLPPVVWEDKCLIDDCYGCFWSGLNQMLLALHGDNAHRCIFAYANSTLERKVLIILAREMVDLGWAFCCSKFTDIF